jgi:hypothetical protein
VAVRVFLRESAHSAASEARTRPSTRTSCFRSLALFATFGLTLAPQTRLSTLFFLGAGVYGIFGGFTFYLPELFPARLRATGAGFCYNIGRVFCRRRSIRDRLRGVYDRGRKGRHGRSSKHPGRYSTPWRSSRSSSATGTTPHGHCGRGCS